MFKRSNGKLYLEYQVNGKIVQKSTRLIDTPQNRALVKKEVIPHLQTKILSGDLSHKKAKTFDYYSQTYLRDKEHLKSYPLISNRIKKINETFGSRIITNIKKGDVKDWVSDRLKINTPKTVKDYLTDIRGVFDVAIDYEHTKENVAKNIKLPTHTKKEIEPFTPKEVELLLSKASNWMKLYLAIGFYTGLRTGEILGLMVDDVDLSKKIIVVKRSISKGKITTPKTKKSIRSVPILDDLIPYLKLPKNKKWLFSTEQGISLKAFPGNRQKEWRELLEECDISYRKIYATRHTFIVSMLKHSDLSILEIAQLAGHSSTQMIIQNYGRFIKGEHLIIDRGIQLFPDNSTDSVA